MILDRNDLRRDWGPSALNVANQASISGIYDLPFAQRAEAAGLLRRLAVERNCDAAERLSRSRRRSARTAQATATRAIPTGRP